MVSVRKFVFSTIYISYLNEHLTTPPLQCKILSAKEKEMRSLVVPPSFLFSPFLHLLSLFPSSNAFVSVFTFTLTLTLAKYLLCHSPTNENVHTIFMEFIVGCIENASLTMYNAHTAGVNTASGQRKKKQPYNQIITAISGLGTNILTHAHTRAYKPRDLTRARKSNTFHARERRSEVTIQRERIITYLSAFPSPPAKRLALPPPQEEVGNEEGECATINFSSSKAAGTLFLRCAPFTLAPPPRPASGKSGKG